MTFGELLFQKVQILLNVDTHALLNLLCGIWNICAEPARVENGEPVQGVGTLGRMNPALHLRAPELIADGREQAMFGVVVVAKIPVYTI